MLDKLKIGKAGEYLTCADLILKGYVAFLSEQGLSYDVVLQIENKLYRIQVKTTETHKKVAQRKIEIRNYSFSILKNGSGAGVAGKKRLMRGEKVVRWKKYKDNEVDIFAFVALDSKIIAYVPAKGIKNSILFRVPALRGLYHDEKGNWANRKVLELKAKGFNRKEIAAKIRISVSEVIAYEKTVVTKGRGGMAYLDDFTLEKCLLEINKTDYHDSAPTV